MKVPFGEGVFRYSDILLAMLLGAWGPCPDEGACPADLNGDAVVNPIDLATLLGAWGECP